MRKQMVKNEERKKPKGQKGSRCLWSVVNIIIMEIYYYYHTFHAGPFLLKDPRQGMYLCICSYGKVNGPKQCCQIGSFLDTMTVISRTYLPC